MPRPPRVPAEPRFSHGEVNRAGALMADLLRALERRPRNRSVSQDPRFSAETLNHAIEVIDWWRGLHARPLTMVNANLRHYLRPHGAVTVTQRLKRYPTVVDKLLREPTMKLAQMADIGGCRALLPDQDAISAVGRQLRKNWTVTKTRDYVAAPKASGYRAVHHIVRRKGRLIEVQLRTSLQDAWANQVENDSRRVGVNFKGGQGQREVHDYYVVVSDLLALRERGEDTDDELRARLGRTYQTAQPFLSATNGGTT